MPWEGEGLVIAYTWHTWTSSLSVWKKLIRTYLGVLSNQKLPFNMPEMSHHTAFGACLSLHSIVMSYIHVDGKPVTLYTLLHKREDPDIYLSDQQCASILMGVCKGLQFIHGQGFFSAHLRPGAVCKHNCINVSGLISLDCCKLRYQTHYHMKVQSYISNFVII